LGSVTLRAGTALTYRSTVVRVQPSTAGPSRPPDFASVLVSVDGPRADLVLNRPEKLNPLGADTLTELAEAAAWLDDQDAVKVVVVSGSGRCFSAGADLSAFSGAPDLDPRQAADLGRRMADAVGGMRPVTIARVHGHCVGGGVVLALACDLRVADENAMFSIPEMALGIPLAWGGIPRLVREIGPSATRDLVLTCRRFDAPEAATLGLVNRLVPADALDETVDELAHVISSRSRLSLEATTAAVDEAAEALAPTTGSWRDADLLVAALGDEESREVGRRYLDGLR